LNALRIVGVASVVALATYLVPACRDLPRGHAQRPCPPIAAEQDTALPPASVAAAPDATVRVDVARGIGTVDPDLTGVVWNAGSDITPLAPVHPSSVRIDASLQSRSPGPGQLDLQPLVTRVAQVRAIGAEPLVILSYMPRWLGAPRAGAGHDPTRMAPYDLDAWQTLVTDVVRGLATAPQPAYRFEVWNEPDIPIFWQDTPEQFVATALRTHQAVAEVKRETGLPLEVGGPAAAFGLNDRMVQYLTSVADAGLPLDFVSWHNYANFPYLGPDGPEGNLPEAVYQALARRNPDSTPLRYSEEVTAIRAKVAGALEGSGLAPDLVIDEWNVSPGGYDVRHDDAEGASLVAGILIEMEHAGLDAANFYRAVSGNNDHAGDWGLVYSDGAPKPSWWVFRAWSTMTGHRLLSTGDDPAVGLWARATRDRGCISVLLTNFVATGAPARSVEIDLDGTFPHCRGGRTATLAALDSTSTAFAHPRPAALDRDHALTVPLASQSVALVQVSCRR
jgi:hypothetical protein